MRRLHWIALFFAGACVARYGPEPASYPPANRAAGTVAHIIVGRDTVRGELLEVRDTALVVLTLDRVVLVLDGAMRSLRFDDLRRREPLSALSPSERERLRLLSRFPQGIPPAALTAILESRRQSALTVIDQ